MSRPRQKAHAKTQHIPKKSLPFDLPHPPNGWAQKPAGISLCMIVKNEEVFLADCLRSVAGVVDEICIVDTGSSDRTIEIARQFGARIEEHAWCDDFAWARNKSLEMAGKRWILTLDADERLTPQTALALRALAAAPAYLAGLWVRCFNANDDYKGTGALSNALIRVFPNHERLRYRGRIHEFISADGNEGGMPAQKSDLAIIHLGYLQEVIASRGKAQRNLDLCRKAVLAEPQNPHHWCNLGMSANLAGEYEIAIAAIEKMNEMTAGAPRGYKPHALCLLADLYLNVRRDYPRAIATARECLEYTPNFSNAHFQLGKGLALSGMLHEARDAFGAAIAAQEFEHEQFVVDNEIAAWKAHSEIAATLLFEQRYETALAWAELGLQNRPNAQPLLFQRAKALEGMGRIEAMIGAYRSCYEAHRDSASTIEYSNALLRGGRGDEALRVIDESVDRVDAADDAAVILGAAVCIVLAAEGESERTKGYLARAIEAAEKTSAGRDLLAVLYEGMGNTGALALLRAAAPARAGLRFGSGLRINAALA